MKLPHCLLYNLVFNLYKHRTKTTTFLTFISCVVYGKSLTASTSVSSFIKWGYKRNLYHEVTVRVKGIICQTLINLYGYMQKYLQLCVHIWASIHAYISLFCQVSRTRNNGMFQGSWFLIPFSHKSIQGCLEKWLILELERKHTR